jgi:hypothetical protein
VPFNHARITMGSWRLFPQSSPRSLSVVDIMRYCREVRSMNLLASIALSALLLCFCPQKAWPVECNLSPEIRSELARTSNSTAISSDFDSNVAPLLALRKRHPDNLLVHELYQDAVQRYGIEGHLRKLTEDYQVLSMQHPDDLAYNYLYARSLMGRNTPAAIRDITKLLEGHPDFAPGYRTLAEIYSAAAFRNEDKEKTERQHFLGLCPGSILQQRPGSLPQPSPLVDQAERLLEQNGDPGRVTAMAQQGIRDDEWRLQRIRPFDWYSVEYKRESQRDLQEKYWKMWSIDVRCDRRTGHPEKATEVLAAMGERAESLARHSDPAYWDAVATLVSLYEEGNQKDAATRELDSMQRFLVQHPDPQRTAQLEGLRKKLAEQN